MLFCLLGHVRLFMASLLFLLCFDRYRGVRTGISRFYHLEAPVFVLSFDVTSTSNLGE